jgi:hypothetical protein
MGSGVDGVSSGDDDEDEDSGGEILCEGEPGITIVIGTIAEVVTGNDMDDNDDVVVAITLAATMGAEDGITMALLITAATAGVEEDVAVAVVTGVPSR